MNSDIFYSRYPQLDLHGETVDIALVLVNDFINDNYKLGNTHIVIIHGRGTGKIKKAVHSFLKTNRYVKEYKQDNFNIGSTIVELYKKD